MQSKFNGDQANYENGSALGYSYTCLISYVIGADKVIFIYIQLKILLLLKFIMIKFNIFK